MSSIMNRIATVWLDMMEIQIRNVILQQVRNYYFKSNISCLDIPTYFPAGTITAELDCDCGPHSQKRVHNGICSCSCLPGYKGSPPTCHPECIINSDCDTNEACKDNNCIDPCPGTCGPNAHCRVVSHSPICTCRPGYTGQPTIGCNKVPSKLM